MKKFEIVIKGEHEDEIGLEILTGIYGAIKNHGYTDVSVHTETVEQGEIQIPDFMLQHQKEHVERSVKEARRG